MKEPDAKRRRILHSAGRRVQIHGLTSDAGKALNGQLATVIAEESSGRLTVEIDGGCRKALKAENLVLARTPLPGAQVEVHGLKSEAGKGLNGKTGVVTAKQDPCSLRYQVDVEGGGVRALKVENLKVLDEPIWGLALSADAKSAQGRRPAQEDRHMQVMDLHKAGTALQLSLEHLPRPFALFAVFDGHMGANCSDYVAKHLHTKLLPRLAALAEVKVNDVQQLLQDAFLELDDDFLLQHDCPDGSTAVVALLMGTDLFVANLGDSCGLLCNTQGADVHLVFPDHKPGSDVERKRIASAGGQVVEIGGIPRVAHAEFQERTAAYERLVSSGSEGEMAMPIALAVSRAFGDRDFKNLFDGEKRVDLVSCVVDVRHVALVPSRHTALVLMSDGVTDVMALDEVGKKVVALDGQPKAASSAVCNESLARRSDDNVTAVTVFFKWGKLGKTDA